MCCPYPFFSGGGKVKHIMYLITGLIILLMIPGYVKAADVSDDYIYISNTDYKLSDELEEKLGNDTNSDYSGSEGYQFFIRRHRAWNGVSTYTQFMGSVNDNGSAVCWLFNPEEGIETKFKLVAYDTQLKNANDLKSNISGSVTINYNFKWVKDNGEILSGGDNETTLSKRDYEWAPIFARGDDRIMVFNSNIPIFDVTSETFLEDLNKYIGERDYSGSMNGNFINGTGSVTYDEEIEKPYEFQTGGRVVFTWTGSIVNYDGANNLYCSWKYPEDDNLSYEIQVRAKIKIPKSGFSGLYNKLTGGSTYDEKWSDFMSYKSGVYSDSSPDVNGKFVVNLNSAVVGKLFSSYILNNYQAEPGLMAVSFDIDQVEIRVRNYKGNKSSRWVSSYITKDGHNETYEKDLNNYEPVESDDYHGQDTSTNTDINYDNININNFIGFIKDGFGLTGSGGLISLFSSFFSYLPSSIGILLLMGVSFMILIAIIRLVLNR